jgi:hypothetical protein
MKKILLTLTSGLAFFCSYAQSVTYDNLTLNFGFVKSSGAANLSGWGLASDNTLDPRPNYSPGVVPYMINNHTGLTFSAHSLYGGIRFYNQGYPNPYSAANGAQLVMSINNGGVAVGIETVPTGYKFAVNGAAIATSMKVKLQAYWPDFVFEKDYKLPTIAEVKNYIDKNQHLPDMPSASDVHANGLDLGEMNRLLLKKVEELTLYVIEQQGRIEDLNKKVLELQINAKN